MFDRSAKRRREALQRTAEALYGAVVTQSRQPGFYRDLGVPDTIDGRFELVVLHAFLVLHRFKRERESTEALGQALFDTLFADMDRNLREMGAGDLGVGKRVKRMVEAFYGRVAAYEAGLEGGDLEEALRRNLYGTVTPESGRSAAMAAYLRRESAALDEASCEGLLAGMVSFGAPPLPRDSEAAELARSAGKSH